MAYPTDGSSHWDGIQNEHDCIEIINASGLFPFQEHLGGTKRLNDSTHFSLKLTEGGTIDYGHLSLPIFKDLTTEAHKATNLLSGFISGRGKKRKWKLSFKERCKLKEKVREIQHEAVRDAFKLLEKNIVIVGATGAIGKAFLEHYVKDESVENVLAFSRKKISYENIKIKSFDLIFF